MENKDLIKLAKEASKKAYAPYSKFYVGAAVLFKNGEIVTGCNVENASYGLSLCAERNALSTAVAKGIDSEIVKIAIVSPNTDKCFPCGACRQWISEFSRDAVIVVEDGEDALELKISELLPYSFDKDVLV